MKLFLGNTNQNENGNFRLDKTRRNGQNNQQMGRRRDLMQERMAAHGREMKMRESEDKRIANLNEEIFRVQTSDMAEDVKNLTISMLEEQITAIFMVRAEREQLAIERELQRQQQEMDERMRERERAAQGARNENKTEEELEEEAERSTVRNLTNIGTRLENIGALQRTRASMSAEATRLRGEADFDNCRMRRANEAIIADVIRSNLESGGPPMEPSFLFSGNPLSTDKFKGRHLQNLEVGISRLSSNINNQIGAMYRDSQKLQEEQLRIYREKSRLPSQSQSSEDAEENENSDMSFDIRL
jgi:hypothetical protein